VWRSVFVAIGIYLVLLGAQCLGVQKFVLNKREPPPQQSASLFSQPPSVGSQKQISPAPWAPWSLMGAGMVVCLYSFSIPKRLNG
jgi:hypothetical protein